MIPIVLAAAALAAHPLGNFSVNRYDGLRVTQDRIVDEAVVDFAELPTLQNGPARADRLCGELATGLRARAEGRVLRWSVDAAALAHAPGAAGLRTSRLTCSMSAPLRVTGRTPVEFANGFRPERVGWREITAVGDGVRLASSSVPGTSASHGLRDYPRDLLASPLDVRTARLVAEPGEGTVTGPMDRIPAVGAVTAWSGAATATLDRLAGADRLTLPVGLAALLLALVLGGAHAVLPGHGKTVMALYLAGRRGRPWDAAKVGATVTLTHTAGVLVTGLVLSASSALAGDSLLAFLAVASGALVTVVGGGLLVSAVRRTRRPPLTHGHGHSQGHGHAHVGLVGLGVAGGLVPSPSALVVLLGAVALGRTAFGVAMVVCYGLGMAATLTAAGLLILRLRGPRRLPGVRRFRVYGPVLTAVLILLVGTGMTVRGLAPLL